MAVQEGADQTPTPPATEDEDTCGGGFESSDPGSPGGHGGPGGPVAEAVEAGADKDDDDDDRTPVHLAVAARRWAAGDGGTSRGVRRAGGAVAPGARRAGGAPIVLSGASSDDDEGDEGKRAAAAASAGVDDDRASSDDNASDGGSDNADLPPGQNAAAADSSGEIESGGRSRRPPPRADGRAPNGKKTDPEAGAGAGAWGPPPQVVVVTYSLVARLLPALVSLGALVVVADEAHTARGGSVSWSKCSSIHASVCPSNVHPSVPSVPSIQRIVHRSIRLSMHPPFVHPSFHPSIHPLLRPPPPVILGAGPKHRDPAGAGLSIPLPGGGVRLGWGGWRIGPGGGPRSGGGSGGGRRFWPAPRSPPRAAIVGHPRPEQTCGTVG